MRTTIAVNPALRDRLMALKARWHCRGLDEVLERLLEGPARTATQLFKGRESEVRAALRRHRVRRLVAFGSRARGEAHPDSDLDLAGSTPSSADLFDLVHIRDDLTKAFGVSVDFVSLEGAPARLRREIERGVVLVA